MERLNCTFGRYYNSKPVVDTKLERVRKSKVLRALKRGFCGSTDDDLGKY